MNPLIIVLGGSAAAVFFGLLAFAYAIGKADGAETVRRAMEMDPREEPTGIQCAACLMDVRACRCSVSARRGMVS